MRSAMKFMIGVSFAALALAGPAVAEVGAKWDPNYEPPRMADGTPSLQGIWTNASLTVLERDAPFEALVVPEAVAVAVETGAMAMKNADNAPTDPDAPAPEAGGAGVGGYNTFWMDYGTKVARINGEVRTSWITEPENGKLPWSKYGTEHLANLRKSFGENMNDPEIRSSGERCTVGFGSTGGPPMLNVLYNNNYQIVQEPDTVAILVEMNHNTRLVRIDDEHRPANMQGWLGDSVGKWEGDTLVVHSTNFHPGNAYRGAIRHRIYLTDDAEVIERFTRVSDEEIFYEFEVTDLEIYDQTWKGEMTLRAAEGPIYEYACHEANYSLPGILGGARKAEADAAAAKAKEAVMGDTTTTKRTVTRTYVKK
ncbi:MAG: hypothetical protein ACRBEQ_04435 [Hyphomonas sp.]